MKLTEAVREFLRYRTVYQGASPASVDQYDRTCSGFVEFVHSRRWADHVRSLSPRNVRDWVAAESARGVGPRTLASRLAHLRALGEHLVRAKAVRSNPLAAIERPRFSRPVSKFLHPEELRAFLRAQAAPHEAIAREVMLDTMLRASEVCRANSGDLAGPDAQGRYTVRVTVKGGREHLVPLSSHLAERLRGRPAHEPLVPGPDGGRWTRTALSQAMVRIGRRAGIGRFSVSAHKLRHTGATMALAAGANPMAVSRLLNHTSLRTTEQYLHLMPGALHEARAAQARAIEEAR